MKRIIPFLLSVSLLYSCHQEEEISLPTDGPVINLAELGLSENDVVQGRMRIKLKEEPAGNLSEKSIEGGISARIKMIGRSASALKITRMERTFPHAGKYEERTRREGLHLWYDVWYSEDVSVARATGEVSVLEGIEIAAPVVKVRSLGTDEPVWRAVDFNDTFIAKQWYLENPGTESWQQLGADIRVADAWKKCTGDPRIIVAVMDGGVQVDHPDLVDNIWVNEGEIPGNGIDDDGNGYIDDINGYNFMYDSGKLTPMKHATHVAGIIAASGNNGKGIAGIAGGNGTAGSGVKLMSTQVLGATSSNNTAAAIKYGADNGAVISQNSWGYNTTTTSISYIDPADKAAIDYFIKYAGCDNDGNQLPDSPMKGGIVIFAAGNDNVSNPGTASPADYDAVVSVAAIAPDYTKASYSNYGSYIDISAPGGNLNGNGMVYSTIHNSSYGDMSGTSMACPMVSGVAALVIQKYGLNERGFTPERLKEILFKSAYDVDNYNPKYAGQLGYGCVDATAALGIEVTDEMPTLTLKNNKVSDGNLLFWVNYQLAGNARIIIYNSTGGKVFDSKRGVMAMSITTIDVSKLAAGYYTMEYQCNGCTMKQNFIKY